MELQIQTTQNTVVIDDGGPTLALEQRVTRLEVSAAGPQGAPGKQGLSGPPGPPGDAYLGGLPVQITNLMPGDLLQLSASSAWTNSPQDAITDGGNF